MAFSSSLVLASLFAVSPEGNVVPTCDGLVGWARDPDDPSALIDVHVYFDGPAGDPVAQTRVATANLSLSEGEGGCTGDACWHGFSVQLPLSRFDGAPHPAYVYGIDTGGDPNVEIANSPAVYTCSPPPLMKGQKRHITSPTVLQAWAFATYFDLMRVDDLALASLEQGTSVAEGPVVAVAEGTSEPLWLLDQGFRRGVGPVAQRGWRIDPATAAAISAAELDTMPEGSPLPDRPILVQGTGAAVYLLDAVQCLENDDHPACAPEESETSGDPDEGTDGSSGGESGDVDASTSGSITSSGGDDDEGTDGSSGGVSTSGAIPAGGDDAASGGCRVGRRGQRGGVPLLLGLLLWRRRRATGTSPSALTLQHAAVRADLGLGARDIEHHHLVDRAGELSNEAVVDRWPPDMAGRVVGHLRGRPLEEGRGDPLPVDVELARVRRPRPRQVRRT